MARVFKRSDRPGADWWIEFRAENGRKVRRKIGPNKRQAQEALDRIKVQVAQRRFLPEQAADQARFHALAAQYAEVVAPGLRWSGRVTTIVDRWKDFLGDIKLRDITPNHAMRFVAERRKDVAPATVNREIAVLKRMLNLAVQWGIADRNPLTRFRMLPERNDRFRYLTTEQATALVEAVPDYLRPITLVAMNTGARRSELTGLKWINVHFETRSIAFVDTKSGRRRDVPMNRIVFETLKAIPKKHDLVFTYRGRPLGDFRGSFLAACRKAGIEDGFRWHDLRHSYATAAMRSGMDIRTLQTILGHRTITMTMRYSHVSSEQLHRAAAAVEVGAPSRTGEAVVAFRSR